MDNTERYSDIRKKLNSVGTGFCLAKWKQVTLHLHIGQNHSCHHPGIHKIVKEDLENNPSALHNTKYKKELRREMLQGKRPTECDYCWKVEDNSNEFSDRTFKSAEEWALPHFDAIKNSSYLEDVNPSYVEVSFSNACNFKCSYCYPQFSTQWWEEIEQFGAYPTSTRHNSLDHLIREGKQPYKQSEVNPYVEAFWKWWPNLYKDLLNFRITGGEPLLHKDTFKVFDYVIDNPNPQLKLAINSNLGAPEKLYQHAKEKIKRISGEGLVREFILFTSCDGWGEQANYIRNGFDYNQWYDRCSELLEEIPKLTISIMGTYNVLSIPSYKKFIKDVYQLKKEFTNTDRYWFYPVGLDSSYLRHPNHQAANIITDDWHKEVFEQAQLMDFYESLGTLNPIGFTDVEIHKLRRIYDVVTAPKEEHSLKRDRKDFYRFFSEHDKRRGTDFVKTFPELEEFWNICKSIR
jgi:sulfatase maturation enzyme AslB (radical SAM superfamily)